MKERNKKNAKRVLLASSLIAGAVFSMGTAQPVKAESLFNYSHLGSGAEVRTTLLGGVPSHGSALDLKCGNKSEKKETTESKAKEGKCGEGKCGDKKSESKAKDHKCGEGMCGGKDSTKADMKKSESKAKDHKCGEGKCGDKKMDAKKEADKTKTTEKK